MGLKEKLAKSDVKIFAFAALGIGVCAYFLFFDSGMHLGSDSDAAELGQVTYFINDARQKGNSSYVWQNVKMDQKVFLGDSIYSGEKSKVQVILNNGSDVNIGENSLVTFGQLEDQKVLDLRLGEVHLKVDGTLKLAVQGKVTTVTGTKSEIKVEVKNKISRVKLVQGQAQVRNKNLPEVRLEVEKEVVLPESAPIRVTANDLPPMPTLPSGVEPIANSAPVASEPLTANAGSPETPVDPALDSAKLDPSGGAGSQPTDSTLPVSNLNPSIPVTSEDLPKIDPAPAPQAEAPPSVEVKPQVTAPSSLKGDSFSYIWKLHDLFVQGEDSISERRPRPVLVPIEYPLSWKSNHKGSFRVQISNGPTFDDPKLIKTYEADSSETILTKAYLGKTYWRVSSDGKIWSEPDSIHVMVRTLKGANQHFEQDSIQTALLGKAVSVNLAMESDVNAYGYVVQSSTDVEFDSSKTKTFWTKKSELSFNFATPTVQYYRFRVVNERQEITDWSPTAKAVVFQPVPPQAPKLAQQGKGQLQGMVGDKIDVKFNSPESTTWMEVYNENDQKVHTEKGTELTFVPKQAGKYRARAFSVNDYGQVGPSSDVVKIDVVPNLLAQTQPERKTASIDSSSSVKIEEELKPQKNNKYNGNRVSAQGMVWALQSTEQKLNQTGTPVTTGVGFNGLWWWNKHGFEGNFKSGVKGLSSAGQDAESIKDFEARYHYRFMGHIPWSSKELEMSYILGYENFENSSPNGSNRYDIMKLGMSFKFPILKNWMGGGEVLVGRSFEQSSKYEISGYFNYFYTDAWSLGAGYRLHLFEAGSTKSTPTGVLPYREGYSEGFSGLNYHF